MTPVAAGRAFLQGRSAFPRSTVGGSHGGRRGPDVPVDVDSASHNSDLGVLLTQILIHASCQLEI